MDTDDRPSYLDGCRSVVEAARIAPGCIDFHVSADPLDVERINIYEQWESIDAVERFRGSGPVDEQAALIKAAHVEQHDIAGTTPLT